jgi:hypothetical protein
MIVMISAICLNSSQHRSGRDLKYVFYPPMADEPVNPSSNCRVLRVYFLFFGYFFAAFTPGFSYEMLFFS